MQVDRVGLQSKLQLWCRPLKWGIHFDLGPVACGNAASAPTHDSAASPLPLCLLLASPRDRPQLNWNGLFDRIDFSVPLPRIMLQPGLAMEEACELGTKWLDWKERETWSMNFPLLKSSNWDRCPLHCKPSLTTAKSSYRLLPNHKLIPKSLLLALLVT